jgi:hypothetical protein
MNDNIDWITLTRKTKDPKLSFIEGQLTALEIPHRRHGSSWNGPVLQIPRERLVEAWDFLNSPVGTMYFGENPDITWDDLSDDNEIFTSRMYGQPTATTNPSLPYSTWELPHTGMKEITMYEADSHVARFGFGVYLGGDEDFDNWLYVQFKGGDTFYRYPVMAAHREGLIEQAHEKAKGSPTASVGSFFVHAIKNDAETGRITCEKLVGDVWVRVPTKKERTQGFKLV